MTTYLDYAATSAIRPACVADAVAEFLGACGASPGRGGHHLAVESGRMTFRCRRQVNRVLGLTGDPGRTAFMMNATHALNTALYGMIGPGDVVVASAYDHNAVLRPLAHLERTRGIEVRMLSAHPDGSVDLEEAERALDGAALLVVNAVSNVLGTVFPLRDVASLARAAGAPVLVDAAQHSGHVTGSLQEEGADAIAFTGHKGLLGPQGTGGLWVREGVEIAPLLVGGTGGNSNIRTMPEAMPDRLEAGTHNAPGLAGLAAGCEFLLERGVDTLHAAESALKARLHDGLAGTAGVRVLSPPAPDGVGVVTFDTDRMDIGELASRLDGEFGVMCRGGLHCAPEVHRMLGTSDTGAVRFSLGWASTVEDVDRALEAVDSLLASTTLSVS